MLILNWWYTCFCAALSLYCFIYLFVGWYVGVCVKEKVQHRVSPSCFEIGSLSELGAYQFGYTVLGSTWQAPGMSCLHFPVLGLQMPFHVWLFTWMLGIWTPIHIFAWQAFYQLKHLPSSIIFICETGSLVIAASISAPLTSISLKELLLTQDCSEQIEIKLKDTEISFHIYRIDALGSAKYGDEWELMVHLKIWGRVEGTQEVKCQISMYW